MLLSMLLVVMQVGGGGGGGGMQVRQTLPPPGQTAGPQQTAAAPKEKQAPAALSGQVISLTGEPLRRAEVTLRRTDARDPMSGVYRVSTDAAGAFTLTNVEPGRYMLMAERTGFVRQMYGAARGSRFIAGSPVQLSPGQELKGISIKMTPQAVISGRVLDDEGEPIARAQVQALQRRYFRTRRQWMPVGFGQVNDLGEYRIAELPPGQYLVAVQPQRTMFDGVAARSSAGQNEETLVTTYYPGATDVTQATPVEVTLGGEARGIDVRAQKARTYRVSGTVIEGITSKPVQNAFVMLLPAEEGMFFGRGGSPIRNTEGKFEIAGVQPGRYYLNVSPMGAPGAQGPRYSGRQEVTVGDGNVENVTVTLSPGAAVSGSVRVEGQAKTSQAPWRVFLESQTMQFSPGSSPSEVKADGTFSVENVLPGRYAVRVAPLEDAYVKSVRIGNQEARDGVVEIGPGGAAGLDVLVSGNAGSVTGVVQDSKKRPAQGVIVVLVPEPSLRERAELFKQATTDPNGAFTLRGIPRGEYKVFAWEQIEDFAWFDPAVLSRYENDGKTVSLKEGARENITIPFIAPEGGSQLEREADEREKAANP